MTNNQNGEIAQTLEKDKFLACLCLHILSNGVYF